jgi:hypothetical protein
MKLGVSTLPLILAVAASVAPSAAFVLPSSGKMKIPTNAAESPSTFTSALSAIDVAYANDAVDIGANKDILLAAFVAAIGGAVALNGNTSLGGGSTATSAVEEEELPKIDVSIEYDAPAKLAFSQIARSKGKDFAKFKDLFEAKNVAEVKKKVYQQKVANEMEQMDKEIEAMQKEIDDMFA